MTIQSNTLNSKKHSYLWVNLTNELSKLLHANIKLVFPEAWNNQYYNWFQEVEEIAFREELL